MGLSYNDLFQLASFALIAYVAIVQRNYIKKIEGINAQFERYIKMFDVKKIEEFSAFKEKLALEKVNYLLDNDVEMKNIFNKLLDEKAREVQDFYIKEKGEEYIELFNLAINILHQNKGNEDNIKKILGVLPKTKDELIKKMEQLKEGGQADYKLNNK